MSVIAVLSAKGAPGTTTTALGVALTWPRPVLLLEADTSGSSSILAGYYRGTRPFDRGLVDLAVAHRRGRLDPALYDTATPLGDTGHARFIPALSSTSQARQLTSLWPALLEALQALHTTGTDVIVDAGRPGDAAFPLSLATGADLTVLMTRTDLPALAAARASVTDLRAALQAVGAPDNTLQLALVGHGQPYRGREIPATVGAPVLAHLQWAPHDARVLSHGDRPGRRFQGGPLLVSLAHLGAQARSAIQQLQEPLTPSSTLALADSHQAPADDLIDLIDLEAPRV